MRVTFGNLADQLSVTNIKIFFLENIKRDPQATDAEIAEATRKTNTLNVLRNNLIEEIDMMYNEIAGDKAQKLYGQGSNKLYGKH